MFMIERELYMKQIRPFINRPFVKVIAGIRRCGKSVVLQMIAEELERQGIAKENIVYMNFESFEWMDIADAKALYLYIKDKVEQANGGLGCGCLCNRLQFPAAFLRVVHLSGRQVCQFPYYAIVIQ